MPGNGNWFPDWHGWGQCAPTCIRSEFKAHAPICSRRGNPTSAPVCPLGSSPGWRSLRPLRLTMVLPLPTGLLMPSQRYLRVPSWVWFSPQSLEPEWLQRLRPTPMPALWLSLRRGALGPLNCHAPVRVSQPHLSRMPRSPPETPQRRTLDMCMWSQPDAVNAF